MLNRYWLLAVLAGCCPLVQGDTIVTASASCQIYHFGALVSDQSQQTTVTDGSSQIQIPGLSGCSSIQGIVIGITGSVLSSIDLNGPNSNFSMVGQVQPLFSRGPSGQPILNPNEYSEHILLGIHFSTQETYIATGGNGIGILSGTESGNSDFFPGSNPLNQSIRTPFGDCLGCSDQRPSPYSYQFVFGQPFTIDVEGDLVIDPQLLGEEAASAGVAVFASHRGVFDSNGNPIPNVTFTLVPEPGTNILAGIGLLLIPILAAPRLRHRLASLIRAQL